MSVNAADEPPAGTIYLTVSGTSAEAGDDGQVGRAPMRREGFSLSELQAEMDLSNRVIDSNWNTLITSDCSP